MGKNPNSAASRLSKLKLKTTKTKDMKSSGFKLSSKGF